jgi:hypothetical protein
MMDMKADPPCLVAVGWRFPRSPYALRFPWPPACQFHAGARYSGYMGGRQ